MCMDLNGILLYKQSQNDKREKNDKHDNILKKKKMKR